MLVTWPFPVRFPHHTFVRILHFPRMYYILRLFYFSYCSDPKCFQVFPYTDRFVLFVWVRSRSFRYLSSKDSYDLFAVTLELLFGGLFVLILTSIYSIRSGNKSYLEMLDTVHSLKHE